MIRDLSPAKLKILASFFTNLAAAWFLAIFFSKNILVLTTDFLLSILSIYLAFILQEMTQND